MIMLMTMIFVMITTVPVNIILLAPTFAACLLLSYHMVKFVSKSPETQCLNASGSGFIADSGYSFRILQFRTPGLGLWGLRFWVSKVQPQC